MSGALPAPTGQLELTEVARLAELEAVIERGLATFVEVGQALLEVRDARLYRDDFPTFEGYCRDRWGMSDRHANRHIEAAATVAQLGPIGPTPASEAVARELVPLKDQPETLRDAWAEVVEIHGEQPTAGRVREVVAEREIHDGQVPPDARGRTRGQLSNQSGGTDAWATPQDFFDALDAEFGFDLDVCALPSSAKCERYFTPEQDGLAQDWSGTCWMNPPYGGEIGAWVAKAHDSSRKGATVVCLVPARVDTGWWWEHCRHGEVRLLRGRLRFGGCDTSAPFPSAVVIFEEGRPADTVYWERAR